MRQKSVARAGGLLFAAPKRRSNCSQKKHRPSEQRHARRFGHRCCGVRRRVGFVHADPRSKFIKALVTATKQKCPKNRRRAWIRPCPEQRNVEIQFAVERVQRYIGTRSAAINVSVIRRCNRRGSHRTGLRCRERSRNIGAVNPRAEDPRRVHPPEDKRKIDRLTAHSTTRIVSGKCDRADYVVCGTHKGVSLGRKHSEKKQTYYSHKPFHRNPPRAGAMSVGQFSASGNRDSIQTQRNRPPPLPSSYPHHEIRGKNIPV